MFEKTLRYPGHVDKIKTLIECGLLDTNPIQIKETKVTPREFLTALLAPKLELGEEQDLVIMMVKVMGDNESKQYTFDLIDHYDKVGRVTSMARTQPTPHQ
jgi:saccharopine dehydrogenase-like NADP-dependent oxidoreductase